MAGRDGYIAGSAPRSASTTSAGLVPGGVRFDEAMGDAGMHGRMGYFINLANGTCSFCLGRCATAAIVPSKSLHEPASALPFHFEHDGRSPERFPSSSIQKVHLLRV